MLVTQGQQQVFTADPQYDQDGAKDGWQYPVVTAVAENSLEHRVADSPARVFAMIAPLYRQHPHSQ